MIDKGNAFGLNRDERGVLRPIDFPAIPNAADGADMGAVELQPSSAFQLGKLKRNKKKGTASGKVGIKAKVTYNATGNALNTLKRKLKLLKR